MFRPMPPGAGSCAKTSIIPRQLGRERVSPHAVVAVVSVIIALVVLAGCGRNDTAARSADSTDTAGGGAATGAAAWQRTTVEAAGTTISVACRGTGGPSVWFVSSLGEDANEGWLASGVPDRVAARTRACVYDRPGLGESGPPSSDRSNRTVENHTAELDEILTAVGETKPVVVVGQGYGAFVARLFAKEHLDRLAGLVLVDPTLWLLPTEPPEGSSDGVRAEYAHVGQINTDLGGYGGAALPPPPAPTFIIGVAADLPARPGTDETSGTTGRGEPDPPQSKRHEMQQGLANKSPFGKFIVLDHAGSAAQYWDAEAVATVIFDVLAHPNLRR